MQRRVLSLLNLSVHEFKGAVPKNRFWRDQGETALVRKARATDKRRDGWERRLRNQKIKFPYFQFCRESAPKTQVDKEHSEFESFETHILDYAHSKSNPLIIFVETYLNNRHSKYIPGKILNVVEGAKLIDSKEVGKIVPEKYDKQHRRHWILEEMIWHFPLMMSKVGFRI